jgi:hypothetical protein
VTVCRVLLALALAAFGGACRSQEARALEVESARIGRAVDALRDAPNPAKAPLLKALEAEACTLKAACELKALCARAYTRHLESLASSERAKLLLGDPEGGTDATLAAASALNQAEAEQAEAGKLTEACAAKQGELRRAVKP